ncbi:MarR family winged helix-turn-helix transcriptional regulator [Oenococcus oeni]|uniref:Transcriptional regulator n=7 Tax=Oenococcus oeni TaxID=1247 RepID=A0A6H3GWW5_OENOE|nr:MarR family transcriptional regulator [Oenococcus oeni]KGO16113.1 ArsR family transcriptional regulator [Oenococcus oeni X2L]EJO02631.1 transcriptional regulator [Oenococcus oeni AWRIB418]KGH54897.1 ArsR family transcriptional regulator [Oenococcus oeni S22]KGH60252.1 ArsR family transcriptional regulator [Oenococcus oeni IOEB_9805]KGH65404.1 ArsR family transcriptional regulator [Oenococcus oeni IOEB_C23]
MNNKEIFEELATLARQPAIWFAARSLYGHGGNQRPDNSRRLLRVLAETDNNLTAGAIADILAIRPASVTQIIKKLENDEYIQRVRDESDARVVRVKITSKGRKQLELLEDKQSDFQTELFDVFDDDERQRFGESLRKLNEHVMSDEYLDNMRSKMDKHMRFGFDHFVNVSNARKFHENQTGYLKKMRQHQQQSPFNDEDNEGI